MHYTDILDRIIREAVVDYDTDEERVAAAQRICDMVKAKSKRMPIRIELKPEMRESGWNDGTKWCHGIVVTDLYAKEPGNGAGTELMTFLFKLADEAGLNVYLDAEGPRSHRFYTKLGMEKDSSGRHHLVKHAELGPEYDYLYESIAPALAKEILTDWRCKRGVKVGKNAKFWRGQSSRSGSGMASFGLGYYFTADKRVADDYAGDDGEVIQVWPTMLPENALRFDTTGDWQIWLQRAQRLLGYKDNRDFVKDFNDIGVFIRSLDPTIDGIQLFTGKDAMFVNYDVEQQPLRESTESATYYHVTFSNRVPAILRDGIVSNKPRNWAKALDGSKYGERGNVFLFSTAESAARWAFKMQWEFKKDVSVLVVQGIEHTDDDPSEEQYLMVNGGGTWKRLKGHVPPENILRAVKWEQEMAKPLVKGEPIEF